MNFAKSTAELFIPDGSPVDEAFAKTTDLGVCTHQDDLEILAYPGILKCFGQDGLGFTGVCVTNGAGSPRDGIYQKYTDDEMQSVRRLEQKKAAYVGEYKAMALLDWSSSEVKNAAIRGPVDDLKALVMACRPKTVWTHNLADKHDTHVASALRLIQALREVPEDARPEAVYGLEVWRDLDWLNDGDKKTFDVKEHENLASALLGVFDSQIAGGKRYDLATLGRRRAHSTYFASHGTDDTTQLSFGMDLTPLVNDPSLDVAGYVDGFIQRFSGEVRDRIAKFR
jgi:LmbE family N-acetylglucosaminyl deacetylase